MSRKLLPVFLIIALVCGIGWAGQRRIRKTVWEYKTLEVRRQNKLSVEAQVEETDRVLNQLGAEGWELVAVGPYDVAGTGVYYLKRAK